MAYNDCVDTIQTLLDSSGFIESKETITLDEFPSSVSDKAYSITFDSLDPQGHDIHDRFFPTYKLKVTAIYFIGNDSFEKYENGTDWNESLVSLIMNPSNYDSSVRVINFTGSTTSQKSSEAKNYLLIENTFDVEVTLLYIPVFSAGLYTDTTFDEVVNGGEYDSVYQSTLDMGTY